MKKLSLVVHADIQGALADALRAMPRVASFVFSKVEGHGTQDAQDDSLSSRDRVVGFVPHVLAELLLEDNDVDPVIEALRESKCGVAGRGSYWLTDIGRQGRL